MGVGVGGACWKMFSGLDTYNRIYPVLEFFFRAKFGPGNFFHKILQHPPHKNQMGKFIC